MIRRHLAASDPHNRARSLTEEVIKRVLRSKAADMLSWLQQWYEAQCDGDWEHGHGIEISNIDNPGWSLNIPLEGTDLEGRQFEELRQGEDERNWIICRVRNGRFEGRGGALNLETLIKTFREWAEDTGPAN